MNKTVKHKNWTTYSIPKASEGGWGQRFTMQELIRNGVPARKGFSPYVGETGVMVPDTVKMRRKAEKILY